MGSKPDSLKGGEGGDSQVSPPAKPPSQLDDLIACVVLLSYAVDLLGSNLDEGPLRTKVLELARQTSPTTWARKYARSGSGVQRDDQRAMAIQVRQRYQDNPREPMRDEAWPTDDDRSNGKN